MDFDAARAGTDGHTDTEDNYSNPAVHARQGLITVLQFWIHWDRECCNKS